ncbi:MAG TPA: DJ-1/PfpI family protein [Methanospirillum sp.]|uniref:DJ-1/PfpI family protein n=1 Tax=Methanospirillum sp. TaxID=45200 RepID=UPI002BD3285A|nr:DJ-1/PfpI family protein [Methanospirillum sp.]HWQ64045.1 DJ-1/PfpI family protein [Methanospirillum sp.]
MTDEKKVLIVIAPRNFRDEELTEPINYLMQAGISYDVISTTRGLAVGMMGGEMQVEHTVSDLNEGDITKYNAILIVGGNGAPEYLWNYRPLLELVQKFDKQESVISAICLAPAILGQAGVLKDKKATVWNDDQAIEEIRKGGGIFTSSPIVVDGRIITANGPTAAAGFGEKVATSVKNL